MRYRGALLIGGLVGLALLAGVASHGARAGAGRPGCQEPMSFAGAVLAPEADTTFSVRGYSPTGFAADERYEVAWCQTGQDHYVLEIRRDGVPFHPACPARIDWDFAPYGLRVANQPMPLAGFSPLDEGEEIEFPAGSQTAASALQDGTEGIERYFYCHQGRWLLAVFD